MQVVLHELQCCLLGKEERPLYSQFKVISNNDIPRTSEPTLTQIGRFKKDKNQTKLKWFYEEGTGEGPQVQYEIAMETLKNSSVQFLLKVDRGYSE